MPVCWSTGRPVGLSRDRRDPARSGARNRDRIRPVRLVRDDLAKIRNPAGARSDFIGTFNATLDDGDTNFAVTRFNDGPLSPFGMSSDHIYKVHEALTDNDPQATATLDGTPTGDGHDPHEAQLLALRQIGPANGLADTGGAERVVVATTDNGFRPAGEHPAGGANDNDTGPADSPDTGLVENDPMFRGADTVLDHAFGPDLPQLSGNGATGSGELTIVDGVAEAEICVPDLEEGPIVLIASVGAAMIDAGDFIFV